MWLICLLRDPTAANTIMNMSMPKKARFNHARIRQALWIMSHSLPSTLVEADLYKKFMASVNVNFQILGRTTESEEEKIIYGFFILL